MKINLNLRHDELDLVRKFWRYRFDIIHRGDKSLTLHGVSIEDVGRPVKVENNEMVTRLLAMRAGEVVMFPWLKDENGVQKDRQDQLYRNIKKAEKNGAKFSPFPLQYGLNVKCDARGA